MEKRDTWYGSESVLLTQAGYAQIEDNPNDNWTVMTP
jgi:hypothetical protein